MIKKFAIDLYYVIVSTRMSMNSVSVLSIDNNKIKFPVVHITEKDLIDINNSISKEISKYLSINRLQLVPQIITIHSNLIDTPKKNTINIICGCLVEEGVKAINSYWIDTDYTDPSKQYSKLIIEVIQKL